jgi:hypothetical protein
MWQTTERYSCAKIQPEDGNLVVEDDIEERTASCPTRPYDHCDIV